MFKTVSKDELFTGLETCNSVIVCDDHYLTEEIRTAFPKLYVKPLSLVREGQLLNATYIITSENNLREGVDSYLVHEEVVEPEVTQEVAEFLDSIDFDTQTIEVTEPDETQSTVTEPVKEYEDMEFSSVSDLASALLPEMKVVARADLIESLREKRPDVAIAPIEKGSISLTEGMVVLLRLRSKLCRKDARKIYPPTATLYTVYC